MRTLKKLKKTTSSDRQESLKPLFKRRKGKRKVGTKIQTDFDNLFHKKGDPVQKEFKISLFKSLSSEKSRQRPKDISTNSKVEFNPYRNFKLDGLNSSFSIKTAEIQKYRKRKNTESPIRLKGINKNIMFNFQISEQSEDSQQSSRKREPSFKDVGIGTEDNQLLTTAKIVSRNNKEIFNFVTKSENMTQVHFKKIRKNIVHNRHSMMVPNNPSRFKKFLKNKGGLKKMLDLGQKLYLKVNVLEKLNELQYYSKINSNYSALERSLNSSLRRSSFGKSSMNSSVKSKSIRINKTGN